VPGIVIAVSDLLFQTRIEGAARNAGCDATIADTPARLGEALTGRPSLVVIDVHETAFPPLDAIAHARQSGARVLAFGRHTAPAELRNARERGADIVVPRSELVERLPRLIARLTGGDRPGASTPEPVPEA